jgi:probable HAF family extracellular repeat protein
MPGHFARCAALAAACLAGTAAGTAMATTYHVVALGGADGQTAGMNSHGVVAGSVGYLPALLDHGAVTMLGSVQGSATSVNSAGSAAGTTYDGGIIRAFVWKSGSLRSIGPMHSGVDSTRGVAINKNGDVLCTEDTVTDGYSFISGGGKKTTVAGPQDYTFVEGAALNDLGDVAGVATPPGKLPHAFARIGGKSKDLGALASGVTYSAATAINASGVVAGDSASVPGTTSDVTAFRWANGTMKNLGALAPSTRSHALAINAAGNVVGTSYADSANHVPHAFLYDGTKMIDLNNRLDGASAGWVLETATGIDDAGAIAGMGVFGGDRMPYLATPVK